jgi:hypothetical protein
MQHLLLKTSNDIVITDYATMSGFCGKLAVLDRRKVPQVPESFVFLLLVHTSGTDICNKSILNWQLRKNKNKKKKHFGEGRRKRRKSKRSETSKQNPCNSHTAPTKLPTLHFAGSPGTSTHPLPIERACPTEAAGPLLVFSTYKAFYG